MPGTLSYFEVEGRACSIRLLLSHCGMQYEDKRLTFPEFGAQKAAGAFPLGSMPIWEEDGFKMCQSSAILRMLGIRNGYYSDDPMTCWAIDSLVDFAEDMQVKHVYMYGPLLSNQPLDESRTDQWMSDFWNKTIPIYEKRLSGHGKKFLAGTDRPTIADFKAFGTIIMNLDSNQGNVLPQHIRDRVKQCMQASPCYYRWVQCMEQECATYIRDRAPTPF